LSVPLHIRNAPTKLMKEMGYGNSYEYAHAHQGNFVFQEFLPKEISGTSLYLPGKNPKEMQLREWLEQRWGEKYPMGE
jgi:putative ATPase